MRQLREKDKMIELLSERERSKTQVGVGLEGGKQKNGMVGMGSNSGGDKGDESYVIKRIKDL